MAKLSSEMADLAQLFSARRMPVTPGERMGFWFGLSLGPAHVIVKSCTTPPFIINFIIY
jgi:hypothetical protein